MMATIVLTNLATYLNTKYLPTCQHHLSLTCTRCISEYEDTVAQPGSDYLLPTYLTIWLPTYIPSRYQIPIWLPTYLHKQFLPTCQYHLSLTCTRCISELRHCCTVWQRLRGLWAYRSCKYLSFIRDGLIKHQSFKKAHCTLKDRKSYSVVKLMV